MADKKKLAVNPFFSTMPKVEGWNSTTEKKPKQMPHLKPISNTSTSPLFNALGIGYRKKKA